MAPHGRVVPDASRTLTSRLRTWLRNLEWKHTLWVSKQRTLRGIPVLVTNNQAHATDEELFGAVDAAFRLIETYRPRTFRRMQRDLARVWVYRFAVCRASYSSPSRTCILDSSFVATFPLQAVASSLVHEGVHARIRRFCRTWREGWQVKEERICRKEEARFGRAIPGGTAVVERATTSLASTPEHLAPAVNWHQASQRAQRMRLRETRWPGWVKSAVARLRGLGSLQQHD
jgi:hypothetical protein